MATMTIRNVDDELKSRLRVRAAMHGRSMEDEAREILRASLSTEPQRQESSWVDSVRARVEAAGGVDLDLPHREPMRDPPNFD
jgi:plasmid stability protein